MPVKKDLPVHYHQQDTNYYCGAACAQMVLDQIGAGLLGQTGLYNDNHSHSTLEPGWYTAPDGLQWTLNNRKPGGFANYFALFALANEDSISRKIVWTIHHYDVAPVALVYGSQHWIVVRGFDVSAAPATANDTAYSINAFDINNPWPPVPATPPPPPHNAADGCGSGGPRGIADEHITYAAWKSTYMTGVPSGYWHGKFVAVCDPEPAPTLLGPPPKNQDRLSGERLLTKSEARDRASRGLKEYGLYDRDSWKKNLTKTNPGEPVLVQRLDRNDDFYYIVPMQAAKKVAPVLVVVDALFGDYLQAVAIPDRGTNLFANLTLDTRAVFEGLSGKRIELGNRQGQLVFRREAFSLYPTLVWKPCKESFSPFYPFLMLTIGDDRIYIRVDGEIFTELHSQDRGL